MSMPCAPPGHEGGTLTCHNTSHHSLPDAIVRADAPRLQDHHVPWAAAAAAVAWHSIAADSMETWGAHDVVAAGGVDADDGGCRNVAGDVDDDNWHDGQSHRHDPHHKMDAHADQHPLESPTSQHVHHTQRKVFDVKQSERSTREDKTENERERKKKRQKEHKQMNDGGMHTMIWQMTTTMTMMI
jgi:hypothetical protein